MKKIILTLMTVAALATGCKSTPETTDSIASDGWVTVTGVAAIRDGNMGLAKDEALKDAKRVAVQEVLGSMVSARSDVQNFQLVSQKVTSKTEGMIEKFDTISASAVSAAEYQVKIRAKVSTALISKTIEEAIAAQGKPRMMVLIDETVEGRADGNKTAQSAIEGTFSDQGFPMVDRETVEKLLTANKKKIAAALGGNNAAAKELGVDAGAEIVFVGSSRVKSAGRIGEMTSMQADLNVRVIDVNTGKILTTALEHGAAPHINPDTGAVNAIKKATVKLSDKMVPQIMKRWDINRANTIALLVTGLDYQRLMVLRGEITEKVRGVKTINLKGSSGRAATLEVEFEGSSTDLADRLLSSGLSIRIKMGEVKPNSLDIQAN